MAEDREAVRAALAKAQTLITLAGSVLDADRAQDAALRAALDRCRVPLRAGSGPSPLSGTTALILADVSRPSSLVEVVAAQAHSRPVVRSQVHAASEVQRRLGKAAELAAPAAQSRVRGWFASKAKREQAATGYARLSELLTAAEGNKVEAALRNAVSVAGTSATGQPDVEASCRAAADVLGLQLASDTPLTLEGGQLNTTRRFLAAAPAALRNRPPLVTEVERAFHAVQDRMVARQLEEIPTSALKQATAGRVRFKTLSDAGCETVQDVLRNGEAAIGSVSGISGTTARQLVAAAQQLRQAVRDDLRFRIDLDRTDNVITRLLVALHQLREYDKTLEGRAQEVQDALHLLEPLTAVSDDVTRLAVLAPVNPTEALARVRTTLNLLHEDGLVNRLTAAGPGGRVPVSATEVWKDFESDSAGYYTTLGQVVDLDLDEEAAVGHLPAEIVEAVHAQPLDESLLEGRVSLRGYQSFGARYALVQRRTLLGDEMGLGKTVQAIAVMAHLSGGGARHHLVVCPASVLVNWVKEVRKHSGLDAFLVHGSDRAGTWKTWQRRGGVAVTTFGTLPVLERLREPLPLVVVDEAHYLKNPGTKRAQALRPLIDDADRVLFLTGTPLENRLAEFQQLVAYLQPDVASRLDRLDGIASPRRFREELAPVYLRRNQQDVLQELPDLVVTREWGSFTPHQMPGYRRAVASRNFMHMRRAAITEQPAHSEKLARLAEIADEAAANGHKVIVFSYFRDVLREAADLLGDRVVGPLTGSVAATKRQAIVDEFGRAGDDAVLLAQITAGGTGMNMQAGSVVVICEPQVKPSLETQAIARAHRMGQLRGVQVHRLLTTDSVDQRMVEILEVKQHLFDEYARGSEVAAASPEAVDVSERKLAAEVIELEMERLAVSRAEQLAAQVEEPVA